MLQETRLLVTHAYTHSSRSQCEVHCSSWLIVKSSENCCSVSSVPLTGPRTFPSAPSPAKLLLPLRYPLLSTRAPLKPALTSPGRDHFLLPRVPVMPHTWRGRAVSVVGTDCLGSNPSLPLTRCVTGATSLVHSMPQFPDL